MKFTSVHALFLAGSMAYSLSGCGQGQRDAADAVAGTGSSAGAPHGGSGAGGTEGSSSSAGAGGAGGSSSSAGASGAGAPMPEGYERLTGAARDFARNVCRCIFGFESPMVEQCAFVEAHQYSGLRIDNPDSKRCFEQELAPAFPEIVECETSFLESVRDCTDKAPMRCATSCPTTPPCSTLPDYERYSEQRNHCYRVLYCGSGQEAEGWRCNDVPDCDDESDEAGCE